MALVMASLGLPRFKGRRSELPHWTRCGLALVQTEPVRTVWLKPTPWGEDRAEVSWGAMPREGPPLCAIWEQGQWQVTRLAVVEVPA